MKNFDVIIIGSGQAGTPQAFKLAASGKKVAFIEKQHLGGTCVNDGCTPTKAYVASARRAWDAPLYRVSYSDSCRAQTQYRHIES